MIMWERRLSTSTRSWCCRDFPDLICMIARAPPWTFVNLALYFTMPPFFKRGCYASFWSTLLSFHVINFIDPTAHSRLADKQKMHLCVFYAFDFVVHWLPIFCLYVPPLKSYDIQARLVSLMLNLTWGACMTHGTMNLSDVYIELEFRHWCTLWILVCCVTPSISF